MKLTKYFIAFLLILPFQAFSQEAKDIVGIWLTGKKESKIEIVERGGKFYGTIIWLKEPNDPDTGKPKKDDKGQPVLNMEILKDFKFDGDDEEWEDGTIYDPESGKTYYCSIELEDKDNMELRGSVDPMGWLGRTEEWTRVK